MENEQAILIELQFLPPINYIAQFFHCDKVIIEQHENYSKRSYRNRCHIAGVNGLIRLSIPLEKGKNEQQPIREVKIAYHEPWQRQHWFSIQSAYGNAPYFEFYADSLEPIFKQKHRFLFDLNLDLLNWLDEQIQMPAILEFSSEYSVIPGIGKDFRNKITPKAPIRARLDPPTTYNQVFEDKHGFLPNLSILDLLFCTGPQSNLILEASK